MREIIKMVVVLSLISGLSGAVLAWLKDATKDRIEEQVLTYVQGPALEQVFPPHDNNPITDRKRFEVPGAPGESITIFPAMKDGKLAGYALETFGQGYGGDIGVIVGFDAGKDALTGIGVTTMKETPGLGTNVAKHGFTTQFAGHPLEKLELKSKGGSIDAVSGASYSSTGAVTAVQKAVALRDKLKDEIAKTWQ